MGLSYDAVGPYIGRSDGLRRMQAKIFFIVSYEQDWRTQHECPVESP